MGSWNQDSLKCIYFSIWQVVSITTVTNIKITFFCLILVFISTYFLFVYLHLTFMPTRIMDCFHYLRQFFYFASLFWLKYYIFKDCYKVPRSFSYVLHTFYMLFFFYYLGTCLEDFNWMIKISWQSYIF